ncbi:MAG: methylenetetrahydrofolate reductase [NAD(P)H] [Gammaproteobacteria bacterium]|nr:methylenetetrahydrofolate reductase [NAD(P)H] [Gammaproteobacteria bacterium]MCY4357113.1 methylenetetrahydrofolate reductase [NAD(P)H] [Gammaproteobacteria bacterium]
MTVSNFSIEFYPPHTAAGEARLDAVHAELSQLDPDFFSVTYGAGGSTRHGTRQLVMKYQAQGSEIAPHLSFSGLNEDGVLELLHSYLNAGISRLVALRGDIPSGSGTSVHSRYASELVEFIRHKTGDAFHIEVACYPEIHPEARSYAADVNYFKDKVEAGANSAITQYFYNADAYFHFRDYCAKQGIGIPIVPGIMPITNYQNLARFSIKCGAEIPQWLGRKLETFGEDTAGLRTYGLEVVSELCERLLVGGAPGLHFYSMNLAGCVKALWDNLSLSDR